MLAANRAIPALSGVVRVVSDCLGALYKVSTLPVNQISRRCQHSDSLKNIMVNCWNLGFDLKYFHVRVHQDDLIAYHLLNRLTQLNCLMDMGVTQVIWGWESDDLPPQDIFYWN